MTTNVITDKWILASLGMEGMNHIDNRKMSFRKRLLIEFDRHLGNKLLLLELLHKLETKNPQREDC